MKNKIINLTEEQVQFLKEIKNKDHWTEAFWFDSLQKRFDDIDTAVVLNGNPYLNFGCYSSIDEAIENKIIKLK